WATHGKPTEQNAHPHRSQDGNVVAVHNGIFENFLELREELKQSGWTPYSETDTECLPELVSRFMSSGLGFRAALRQALRKIEGFYAVACMDASDPHRLFVARKGPPLVVGLGDG